VPLWFIFLLVTAVSLDSLVAGMAYGMRGVRVPAASVAVVGACTGALMTLSMATGRLLAGLTAAAATLGGGLLVVVGMWQLFEGWHAELRGLPEQVAGRPLCHVRLPLLGLAVQVLRDPLRADADRSGAIEGHESLVLGGALGLDAFAAGFAAAMMGLGLWLVPLVAAGCGGCLLAGTRLGARVSRRGVTFVLPGLLLIAIGLARVMSS